jgi:hypothetical protein
MRSTRNVMAKVPRLQPTRSGTTLRMDFVY